MGVLNGASSLRDPLVLSCRDRNIDAALAEICGKLITDEGDQGFDVRFRIAPHPIHGDSQIVQNTMAYLAGGLGLLQHTTGSFYRFSRNRGEDPQQFHDRFELPGEFQRFRQLGGDFLAIIDAKNRLI